MDRFRRPHQRTLSCASKKGIAFYTMPLIMFLKYLDCEVFWEKGIPTGFKGFAKRRSLSFFRGIKPCRNNLLNEDIILLPRSQRLVHRPLLLLELHRQLHQDRLRLVRLHLRLALYRVLQKHFSRLH